MSKTIQTQARNRLVPNADLIDSKANSYGNVQKTPSRKPVDVKRGGYNKSPQSSMICKTDSEATESFLVHKTEI